MTYYFIIVLSGLLCFLSGYKIGRFHKLTEREMKQEHEQQSGYRSHVFSHDKP